MCHEALVGNNGDSDDELSDNPLMPVLEMSEAAFQAQNKAMESALATLQSVSGSLSLPLQFTHQSITAAQIERNLEFLKQVSNINTNIWGILIYLFSVDFQLNFHQTS